MSHLKIFEFSAAVRGYHYYRRFWVPQPSQKLCCFFEPDNPFDEFAIKVCEEGNQTPVGHLPREIARATKFFIERGASISVQLTSEHYRRSPLVQGGMEIACKVTASIPGTCINLLLMERYKQLIQETYTEPQKEEILGCYLHVAAGVSNEVNIQVIPRNNMGKTKKKKEEVKTKDIRNYFNPVAKREVTKVQTKEKPKKNLVVID